MHPTVYKDYQDALSGFLQAHCIITVVDRLSQVRIGKKMGQKHSHGSKVSSGRGGEGRRGEERGGEGRRGEERGGEGRRGGKDLDRVGELRAICES